MSPRAPVSSRFAAMGRALRSRNYRLFFLGQGTSLVGTWLTRVAMSWLVYRLTGSALVLGAVGFASQIPTFALAPVAGVLVDRWDRHRVLVVTQALAMAQSAALAALALSGVVRVGHVLALGAVQGVVNAFDTPARQALVVDLVEDRAHLPNAIALNSTLVNGARLVGPSIAGVLIAAVGEGACFAIDAVSYAAVLASLLAMRLPRRRPAGPPSPILAGLGEGLRYVAGFPPIRDVLLLLALVSFTGMPYTVLMPVFAVRVLGGGPHTLGLLMAATGVGAVAGALGLASRRSVLGLGRVLVASGALFGAGLVVFAASRTLALSVVTLVLVGGGMMATMASCNTLVQTLVDEDKRGRTMAFFTMAFFGMVPFGSLASGAVGERLGAPAAVALGGVATLVGVAVFARRLPALRALARPVYVRLGLVPGEPESARPGSVPPPGE